MDTVQELYLLKRSINELTDVINDLVVLVKSKNQIPKKVYSSDDAAEFLRITKSTLDKHCSQRKISFSKDGKLRRFTEQDLLDYAFRFKIKSIYEIQKEVRHGK